jgi:hypothetical protein
MEAPVQAVSPAPAADASVIAEPAPGAAPPNGAVAAGMTPALGLVDEKIVIGGSGSTARRAAKKKAAETTTAPPALDTAASAPVPAPVIEVAAPAAAPAPAKPSFQDQLKAQHDCLVSNRCDN